MLNSLKVSLVQQLKQFKMKRETDNKHIAIVSTIEDNWGGSEELWAKSTPYFQIENYSISVLKRNVDFKHKRVVELQNKGIKFIALSNTYNRLHKLCINGYYRIRRSYYTSHSYAFENFLKKKKPSVVIISQGVNFDGLYYGLLCMKHSIKYIIICHKAVDFYWPPKDERKYMIDVYKSALKCYFVSNHNQNLTEEQFGFRFDNAKVIRNPIKLKQSPLDYPSTDEGFKLVMIGRLYILDKGHDILLRILAKDKWKIRDIHLSIVGDGPDYEGLKSMASLLNIKKLDFLGFQDNIEQIWLDHHALVIPSRSEGLPLVVVEAMAVGRTVIATYAGGTQELIQNGVTGYIGDATEKGFEDTLEKAWSNRNNWKTIGLAASKFIKKEIKPNPEIDFVKEVISLIHE